MRIAITNCKARKQDYACSVDEIYNKSHLYKAQKEFFIKGYDDYYVMSFAIGIKHHTDIIEPYELCLSKFSSIMASKHQVVKVDPERVKIVNDQLLELINKGWIIDLHTSRGQIKLLSKEVRDKVNYIKQPRGVNNIKPIYEKATQMLDTNSLEDSLKFISKKHPTKYIEEPKWFYHPVYEPFFGKSKELKRICPEYLDEAGIKRVSIGIFKQHRGWVIHQSYLNEFYQTDSGQWRFKKQN